MPQSRGSASLSKVGFILALVALLPVLDEWHALGTDVARLIAVPSASASQPAPRDSLLAARVYQARQRAESGDLKGAESALRGVLRDSTGYDYALYELSVVLSWRGTFDESLKLLDQLLQQQPTNSGLHAEMGRVLLWKANSTGKRGYSDEAIAHFSERLRAAPGDGNALKLRAAAYLALHRYAEAEGDLRDCLMSGRQDPEAQSLLAQVLRATGRAREASTLEGGRQKAKPGMNVEGISSRAEVGLDHQLVRLESWHNAPRIGTLRYEYARWEFTEEALSPIRLDRFTIRCEHPLTRSLLAKLGVGYGSFTGATSRAGEMSWSADLCLRPADVLLFEGGYTQGHLLESYATLTPDYQARKAVVHMMIGREGGSELSLSASYARHPGVYGLGYWNDFHQRWITLDTLRDNSSRWALNSYFRQWLSHGPEISVLLSKNYFESNNEELLPYWSPALFSEEKLILIVSNIDVGPISIGFSGGGSHVREGKQWGYSGAICLVASFSSSVRVGAEVSYDKVATAVEWTGEQARVFAGWR